VTAAGSLAARARAAAGSSAARSAAAKAVTARTAAAKAASAGATTARTAAARATTAAKAAARTKPAAAEAATVTEPATAATQPAPATSDAAPVLRPTPRPRPRPAAAPVDVETAPVGDVAVETVAAPVAPSEAPAFVDEALAQLQAEPAEVALVTPDHRRTGRHRMPVVRRRSAFYVAAGLLGALSVGGFADTDPAARAEAPAVAETVSVAEQLGIDAQPATALADAESTRLLQELVASRNERDAASTAAADAQRNADFFAAVAAAEAARPKVVAPINGARLTSGFGARWGTVHAGIDLAAPMRTPEYSVMDGVVLEAGPAGGYGLVVYIQHDSGDVTVYGHMDEILVEPGQVVRAGDTIALLGNRGQSTGPHLHFEVHVGGMNGTKVDPLPWLRQRGVQI
jgi:murein DD-endopeptidase MepM/ murein hydrolase activator NlpD